MLERKNKHEEDLDEINKIQLIINNLLLNQSLVGSINEKSQNTLNRLLAYKERMNLFKRGPQVNFEIYEHYERLHEQNNAEIPVPTQCKPEFFYNDVLPYILYHIRYDVTNRSMRLQSTHQPLLTNVMIYAFAHGSLIRKIWKENNRESYDINEHPLEMMMNTAIITDKIKFNEGRITEHNFSIDSYEPEKIREIDTTNFEIYNRDICAIESVKGVINYMNNDEHLEQYRGNSDVDFYFTKKPMFTDDLPSQFGGNKHNNVLYKIKYFELKNNLV